MARLADLLTHLQRTGDGLHLRPADEGRRARKGAAGQPSEPSVRVLRDPLLASARSFVVSNFQGDSGVTKLIRADFRPLPDFWAWEKFVMALSGEGA